MDSCEVDALILIPIFIHDFLCVHPFNDGNGRMSRLLTTLLLYRQGYVVGRYISMESKIEKTKEKYYEVLEMSKEIQKACKMGVSGAKEVKFTTGLPLLQEEKIIRAQTHRWRSDKYGCWDAIFICNIDKYFWQ